MRNSNIKNSIADVVSRFSDRVNSMLQAFDAPQQQWHLQPCVGPISDRCSGAVCLLGNLGTVGARITGTGMPGSYLPGVSEPTYGITANMDLKRLFQRLG